MDPSTLLARETIIDIFSYLEPRDLKAVRLVCRPFETLASPHLFTKAYIAARRGVFDVFKQITSHSVLSNYIREIVYDASWFEPSVAASLENFSQTSIARGVKYHSPPIPEAERRDYETYVRLFNEQERILSDELPVALEIAFKISRNIRRVTFADFSRNPYILGDRAEDFGDVFHSRCNSDSWVQQLPDAADLQRLPRKFGVFKLFMKTLSASASLESVEWFAAGDGASSSESSYSSGIPHTFFSRRCDELPQGVLDGLKHLRKLDLSILVMGTMANEDVTVEVDALKELLNTADCLEEIRLVRSDCLPPTHTPYNYKYASLSIALLCGSKTWKNLRTLELRHFILESAELLDFLRRHRHCLQMIDIDDLILLDRQNRLSFYESIVAEYPKLDVDYNRRMRFRSCRFTICGSTDPPVDEVNESSTDNSSDDCPDDSSDDPSTTSEDLEFAEGFDDDSDLDSLLGELIRDSPPSAAPPNVE